MIVGIGVDLVSVVRIERSLNRWGERFAKKLLTDEELAQEITPAYLSKQFAAKEAVSKALGTGMGAGVQFRQIEVLRKPSGLPIVTLYGAALDWAVNRGIVNWHLSISDEKDAAIAFAVAESG